MNPWLAIVVAGIAVYSWKILGFMVPARVMEHPKVARIAALMTVALLAALVGVQTFATKAGLSIDARLPAVLLAALLAKFRVPFIVIVLAAAGLAALLRAVHWMA